SARPRAQRRRSALKSAAHRLMAPPFPPAPRPQPSEPDMRIRAADDEASIHLDFVPLADTLFNLLIFFLLATTIKQAEREMQIALPHASAATPISTSLREFIINVDGAGQIVIAGRVVDPETLRGLVKDAVAANPLQKV